MAEGVSTRSGSKLSGQGPGNASLDLNRQMGQSNDPQGMYVVGADGTPYGFTNDHEAVDIDRFMTLARKRFAARPPKPTVVTEAEKRAAFSITLPAGAQALQVFARIPSPPGTCSLLNNGVGRDFCWVYAAERQEIARKAALGAPFALPATLARRIARFHLVDDVRGTPNMWEADELRSLRLSARPDGPGKLVLDGTFALRSRSGKRGYEGRLDGAIAFDPRTLAWTRVRLLADGTAFGAGTYTPNQPPKPYRLLVGLLNTDRPEARIVPPEEVATFNRDTRYRNP